MLSSTKSRYTGKRLLVLSVLLFTVFFSLTILAQVNYEKSKPTIEKGKIIIKVKEGVGPYQRNEGAVSFGIPSLDQKVSKYEVNKLQKMFIHKPIPKNSGLPDISRIYQIEFPEKYNVVIVAKEFYKDPNIEYAEPIPVNYLLEVPNDPLYAQQWYLHKIQADLAWDIHKGEEGDSVIILGITDTGCRYQHPDIGQNIWNNLGEDADGDGHTLEWNGTNWVFDQGDINNIDNDGNGFIDDLIGWNLDNNNMYPNDQDGHGTIVSGIAGATTNNNLGVASISYNLKVMLVKGLYYNSIIYAAENGADVINCSWGSGTYSEANQEVIEYVSGLGSIIVAAAGNTDKDEILFPAGYPYVIAVAAIDSQNVKTPYSTYGASVDISAPGPQTSQPFISLNLSDGYGYATLGTSFSSPIITGMLGLIKSYHPSWTTDELLKQLLYTTDNIDLINPGYEHLLGTGKVNAYHSLADSNLTITPELKINMTLLSSTLRGDSKVLYPNSVMNLSIRVQNFSHFLDANPLTITLTSNNPDIQIIDGEFTGMIAANSMVELLDEFQIQVSPSAITSIATLSFNATANLPVVAGDLFEFNVIVNPSGTLVWEGIENGQDYSGYFIKNYLNTNSYSVIYTTDDVLSFNGMDAVFLSFGNYGSGTGTNTSFNSDLAAKVQEYLESGGKVYIEGGDAIGFDQAFNAELLSLLGIASADDGLTNIINSLEGQTSSLTNGMLFTSSTQVNNTWIDRYIPNSNGTVAFYESNYANVAVQGTGIYGQKSFSFSYALAGLVDANAPSTRDTLLQRIIDFFDLEIVPVELTSFTAITDGKEVTLNWTTATEINNQGFEIQRSPENSEFITIGFVEGNGTTTEEHRYSFKDKDVSGFLRYRLKQIDFDGSYEYSDIVEVEVLGNLSYELAQNYPNPFNPITNISYTLPAESQVKLSIYNTLGELVETLVNEKQDAGKYDAVWNAANHPSGVYIYTLDAVSLNGSEQTKISKKMILMK